MSTKKVCDEFDQGGIGEINHTLHSRIVRKILGLLELEKFFRRKFRPLRACGWPQRFELSYLLFR